MQQHVNSPELPDPLLESVLVELVALARLACVDPSEPSVTPTATVTWATITESITTTVTTATSSSAHVTTTDGVVNTTTITTAAPTSTATATTPRDTSVDVNRTTVGHTSTSQTPAIGPMVTVTGAGGNANVTATAAVPSFDAAARQQAVQSAASVAGAFVGVLRAPLAANKGTTTARVLTVRDCRRSAASVDLLDPTQYVYVFELGGHAHNGALLSTALLQGIVAAAAVAAVHVKRVPSLSVVHLAVLSYYGPNVVALATAVLSAGEASGVAVVATCFNVALVGVATVSTWKLAAHHEPLWHEARDVTAVFVRMYGVVDLACAFIVAAVTGLRMKDCTTQAVVICVTCFANFAYTVVMRPERATPDNVVNAVTTFLVFCVSLLAAAAPREPRYDDAVVALAAALAAWMYVLLAAALFVACRKVLCRRRRGTEEAAALSSRRLGPEGGGDNASSDHETATPMLVVLRNPLGGAELKEATTNAE